MTNLDLMIIETIKSQISTFSRPFTVSMGGIQLGKIGGLIILGSISSLLLNNEKIQDKIKKAMNENEKLPLILTFGTISIVLIIMTI